MATGKTAVGQVLAKKLNRQFIELDALIEQRAGKTIPEIFQQHGEIAFRELEIEAAREVAGCRNSVIACGGGIVLNKINTDRLREAARIVYLTASPKIVLERVSSEEGQRPLLEVEDPALVISELLRFRKAFYELAADITIDTSELDIDSVAEQIINRLKEDEGFSF